MTARKECPRNGCTESVRLKDATEMPTLTSSDDTMRTVFVARYCDGGHLLGYGDRQEPIGPEAPIRNK